MRQRSETIGTLGRAPARSSKQPPLSLPPSLPEEPPPERGVVRRWLTSAMFDNIGLKFLSMVLAVTVFLLVNTDKDREITARVGVSYTLPEDKVLISARQEDVRVQIKGSWRRLRNFHEGDLERINLDLRRVSGGEVAITPDMLHLPSGLTVTNITPRSVRIAFDKRIEKVVEVNPTIAGRPQHGYVITDVKAVPATIKVRGAEGLLAALTSIRTRHQPEISIEGRTDSFSAESEVDPPDGVEVVGSPEVAVQVHIDEELVTRKLPGLSITLKGDGLDPARWVISPPQVEVTLTGALLAVDNSKNGIAAVVKLGRATDPNDNKPRELEVTVEGLPPGIGVKISPEHVKVAPLKPASPPPPDKPATPPP